MEGKILVTFGYQWTKGLGDMYVFAQILVQICAFIFPLFSTLKECRALNSAYPGSAWASKVGEVLPQASDEADMLVGVSSMIAAVTGLCYATYLLYKDLSKPWPSMSEVRQQPITRVLTPQAELGSMSVPASTETEQNVSFMDTHPGYKQSVDSTLDSVRTAALNDDATLDNFFSRPIKIRSLEWGVSASGGLLFERFNPWQLYFENPRVINRISNYKLMSAKLCVKFTLNGNAFHYGRLICAYNPMSGFDTMTIDREFVDADIVAASQRPHVYLDPTNSQGGELCLPFFTPRNLLDITSMDWREMGEIDVHSMQGLKHALGATDTVTVNVFVWAEDVRFALPTSVEPGAITPQAMEGSMDEYGKRPVSRIAGAVANFASRMADAPWIGPYARATEIGASAIGTIATLFGYSSPANIEMSQYRPLTLTNYSVTNMPSDAQKLSVDAKQELTVDPRTVGLSNVDELDINYIAGHESWYTRFEWNQTALTETLLFNTLVDPGLHNNFGEEIHMTAPCFAVNPFKYWRGTLRFRFQIVCSKYHKGRLKIVYDPSGNITGSAEYNTAYTSIVDISDTTDFAIDVGWGQREPYRQHVGVNAPNSFMFGTSPLTYNSADSALANGTLAVYVVNQLAVPNSTIDNDISINVFVSACDDFEVASPDYSFLEKLRYTTSDQLSAPGGNVTEPPCSHIRPQAEEGGMSEETMKNDSEPQITSPVVTMANKIPSTADPTNLIYFGEKIKSMRQLAKRFSRHRILPGDGGTGGNTLTMKSHAFPNQIGYTLDPPIYRTVFALADGNYLYGWQSFLNYLTPAYGGWRGSIRTMLDFSEYMSHQANSATMTVSRDPDSTSLIWDVREREGNTWLSTEIADELAATSVDSPFNGSVVQNLNTNPLVVFEVPYQLPHRFSPAKRFSRPSVADPFDTGYVAQLRGTIINVNRSFAYTHVAGGEDFTCFFYLGPPIFYLEGEFPGTTPPPPFGLEAEI